MEHVFFARFPQRDNAEVLLRQLHQDGLDRGIMVDVIDRAMHADDNLPLSVSNVRIAIVKGLVLGAAGGLLLGIFLGTIGVGPSLSTTAIIATVLGALVGALGAGLVGVSDPDQRLERLLARLQPGEVVLSFHAPSLNREEEVMQRVKVHGEVVPRPLDV